MDNTFRSQPEPLPPENPSIIPPSQFNYQKFVLVLIALGLFASTYLLLAQNYGWWPMSVAISSPSPTPDATSNWQTYTNAQYGFEFKYPPNLLLKTDIQGIEGTPALAQVEFTQNSFPKTNFVEAGIAVADLGQKSDCLTRIDQYQNFTGQQTINGIVFKTGSVTGAAAGNLYESSIYRTIHDNACIQITIVIHTGNIGNYPEGTVSEFNKSLALGPLNLILSTFKFTNSIDISAWKTYRNEQYGFEIKIPEEWTSVARRDNKHYGALIIVSFSSKVTDNFAELLVYDVQNRTPAQLLSSIYDTESVSYIRDGMLGSYSATLFNLDSLAAVKGVIIQHAERFYVFQDDGSLTDRILSTFKFTR